MIFGYARVSAPGQDPAAQVAELTAAGCGRVFTEKASAAAGRRRPALRQAVAILGYGDLLIVTSMSRLARSARDALNTLDLVQRQGAMFKSLGDPWADTTTAGGRLLVTVISGFAEFDREMILKRTAEGRAHAKAKGVKMGRPSTLNARQVEFIRAERAKTPQTSLGSLEKLLGVSRSTICRAAREGVPSVRPDPPPQLDIEDLTGRPSPA